MDRMPPNHRNFVGCETSREHFCALCGTVFQPSAEIPTSACPRCLLDFASTFPEQDADDGAQETYGVGDASEFGSYALIEEIGRGGMGIIYRAIHCGTGRAVALKTVLPRYASCQETLTRFERETEAVAVLDHPCLMPIFEVGRATDGKPFFTMRLAGGGSLDLLREKYRGRWRQIAELIVKLAGAIQHAHDQGVLHRDIKPSNILFTEDQEPLLSDFGLAKPMLGVNDLTQSFAILGTPNYLSPEQATGQTRNLTGAVDIFSLGAVFYELLTGRPPYVGENPLQVIQDVSRKKPARPRSVAPAVPGALETICLRCLERHPEDRYATAADLADDLESWLSGRRINSRPLHRQWWKRARRLPTAATWGVGITSVLLVAAAAWLWALKPAQKYPHATSIAVAIDDLGQGPELAGIARRATASLKDAVSATSVFQITDAGTPGPSVDEEAFDPLKYGRAAHAEVVLTGCVRRASDQIRFVTRLLRCDTGKVVWRHTSTIPSQQLNSGLSARMKTVCDALQNEWRGELSSAPPVSARAPQAEALAFYTKGMELTTRKNRRDFDSAVELLRRACALNPQFAQARAMLAMALWTEADAYGQSRLLPEALSTAREALREDGDCAQAHRVIAMCLYKEGRFAEALDEFWCGVELDPQSAGCAQSLGMDLRDLGRLDEAIHWLRRATRLSPARGVLFVSLAEALIFRGDDDEAETLLRHVAELDRDQPDAEIDLSALRTWQRRFPEARRLCGNMRNRFPDNRFGLSLAAWIEFCDEKEGNSKALFEKLREEHSYQVNWEFYGAINPSSALAYLALRAGSNEEARVLADEAIAIDRELLGRSPNNPRVLHDLGATFSMLGNLPEAQRYRELSLAAGWAERRSALIDPRFANLLAKP